MTTQDDINNFVSGCGAACFLTLAAQTHNDTANRIMSVATVNDLPDLTYGTVMPGTVVFVESLNIPVLAQVGCWTGLDNRELRNDFAVGFAYGWGLNTCGRLGDGTITSRRSPVNVVGDQFRWCQISAADCHSVAVTNLGVAWAWGMNTCGRLGDGTVANKSSPVTVVGGITNWCQISGGLGHTLAVTTTGCAWAWGLNATCELGDSTTVNKSSPVSVVGGFCDWCQVSAGCHSLGVRSGVVSGSNLWAWGFNNSGQLGNNTTTNSSSPVSVLGGFSDWCQASAGNVHTLAVRSGGSAWAWGSNGGRLGNNTTTNQSSPISVVGGFSDWCQVSAGVHSLGVKSDGTAWAWGTNTNAQLGDNTTTGRSSPVSVVGGFTDWCQISAARVHSLAVRQSGSAWAWGFNGQGRLGDNTITNRSSPVSVVGGFSDWCNLSANGDGHSLGIRNR
jgi:alpha-tubulin suppressor-like RCC1 family protein